MGHKYLNLNSLGCHESDSELGKWPAGSRVGVAGPAPGLGPGPGPVSSHDSMIQDSG